MSLAGIFASAVAPIVAIGAVGYLLGRTRGLDVDPLNTVLVYVLIPALVFHSLATTTIDGRTVLKVFAGVTAFVVAMTLLAEVAGRAAGVEEPLLSALVLESVYPNSGNLGIPLSAFAFGAVGRSTAVLFLTAQAVLIYTHGVYVAARTDAGSRLAGVRRVFAIPLVYAVVAAVALRWLGALPPADSNAMETLRLVGDSSIPLMLIMLGSQLVGADLRAALGPVSLVSVLKLLVAPAVGLTVVLALGVANTAVARVFVLECATPAAITPLILVLEFGGDGEPTDLSASEFVSTTVLTSTLASMVTLTLLIAVLRSGVVL